MNVAGAGADRVARNRSVRFPLFPSRTDVSPTETVSPAGLTTYDTASDAALPAPSVATIVNDFAPALDVSSGVPCPEQVPAASPDPPSVHRTSFVTTCPAVYVAPAFADE